MMENKSLSMIINGIRKEISVSCNELLVDTIRKRFNLTGTKKGCEVGECGSCTIIMEGEAVHSCMILTVDADGKEIITIEGLEQDGKLQDLQESFIHKGAIQCGYCTPGMLLSLKALFDKIPVPSVDMIKTAVEGNLCRCGSYPKIVNAASEIAEKNKLKKEGSSV